MSLYPGLIESSWTRSRRPARIRQSPPEADENVVAYFGHVLPSVDLNQPSVASVVVEHRRSDCLVAGESLPDRTAVLVIRTGIQPAPTNRASQRRISPRKAAPLTLPAPPDTA